VIKILSGFPTIVERASVDEAYIDLTDMVEQRLSIGNAWDIPSSLKSIRSEYLQNNFVIGVESSESWLDCLGSEEMMPLSDAKLAIGAEIVGQIRKAIFDQTGFRCSAGIAHNKVTLTLITLRMGSLFFNFFNHPFSLSDLVEIGSSQISLWNQ